MDERECVGKLNRSLADHGREVGVLADLTGKLPEDQGCGYFYRVICRKDCIRGEGIREPLCRVDLLCRRRSGLCVNCRRGGGLCGDGFCVDSTRESVIRGS